MNFDGFIAANKADTPEGLAKVVSRVPMGRLGSVDECAALCCAYLDGTCGFVTGQFVAHDGETVLVTKGYHSSVACPSSHMFFLNYLAGELVDEDRRTPPCFHDANTRIQHDWGRGAWELPVVEP